MEQKVYNLDFKGVLAINPQDFIEFEEDELDEEIEGALIESSGIAYECLTEWSLPDEFYEEWHRLKENA